MRLLVVFLFIATQSYGQSFYAHAGGRGWQNGSSFTEGPNIGLGVEVRQVTNDLYPIGWVGDARITYTSVWATRKYRFAHFRGAFGLCDREHISAQIGLGFLWGLEGNPSTPTLDASMRLNFPKFGNFRIYAEGGIGSTFYQVLPVDKPSIMLIDGAIGIKYEIF